MAGIWIFKYRFHDKEFKIKVLFLVSDKDGINPSSRFRAYAYSTFLKGQGIKCVFSASRPSKYFTERPGLPANKLLRLICVAMGFVSMFSRRLYDVVRSMGFNVVFLQKPLFPGRVFPICEKLLALANRKVVFDFDDAVFMRRKTSKKYWWSNLLVDVRDCERIIRSSFHVIAGNKCLAVYARRFNQDVTIIPSPIDTEKYKPSAKAKCDSLIIGWIGTNRNLVYLEGTKNVLQRLSKKYTFTLKIVCDPPGKKRERLHLQGVPYVFKTWNVDDELRDIQDFDIGIMPLSDDPWTRGKCSFKALQYMSCGIPSVISPVGMNSEVIQDGENGFLAATEKEWEEKIEILIKNPELRRKMGRNARLTVERKYSVKVCGRQLSDLLHEIARQ